MKKLWVVALLMVGSYAFGGQFDATVFMKRYNASMASNTSTIRKTIRYLNVQLQADPGNPEIIVFKGSLLAKLADKEFWFWNKLADVNKGIDLMAKGVDMLSSPRGQEISPGQKLRMHIIRGITSAYIPTGFKQQPVAKYELVWSMNNPLFPQVDRTVRAQVMALLSRVYKREGKLAEAKTLLERAMSTDPEETGRALGS